MRVKRIFFAIIVLCLGLSVMTARAGGSTATQPAGKKDTSGKEIAQTLSQITGVAISPLMGVSVVGAWDYFHAKTPEAKAKLNWYADPMFWVPALLLVGACFLKDSCGVVVPTALKSRSTWWKPSNTK